MDKYIENTEGLNPNEMGNPADPFSRPRIEHYQSEREAKVYLTREDILELGFLRSNPEREIYRHTTKPNLYLFKQYYKDYSVKDLVVENISIWTNVNVGLPLYSSTKPNKEDIQQVIDNYAA